MTAKRLVVLRALGLGDFCTAVPALRALAEALPGHRRLLAAPAAVIELTRFLDDAIDHVVPVDFRAAVGHLPPTLAGADVAVNLHGSGPESHHALLRLGPRNLIAFAHPAVPGGPRWRAGEHEVARWCRLLAESGIPADPARLRLPVPPSPAARGATIVHPGATSAARRWPADRWATVAASEAASGRRVLVTGGPGEDRLAGLVATMAGLPADAVLAGHTSLAELAGLIAGADRVVCGDTGVAHLATATATPSVVLFGPTDPARWGPPPGDPRHQVRWTGTTGNPHANTPDPGLLQIGVHDVLAALAELPDPVAARP